MYFFFTQEMNIGIQKIVSCQNMKQAKKLKTWTKNISSNFYLELLKNKNKKQFKRKKKLFLYKNIRVKQDQKNI